MKINRDEVATLTPKQKKFCLEYVRTANASEAYRLAYDTSNMKQTTVNEKASLLLKEDKIRTRVAELQEEAQERTGVHIDDTVKELAKIGFHDVRKLYNEDGTLKQPHELDSDTSSAIAEISVRQVRIDEETTADIIKYKFANKEGALDKLMKHLGGYDKDNAQKITSIVVRVEE